MKRALRVFLAPGILLAACMVADVALRYQAYSERLGYLYYRAGIVKIIAAYGLSLAVTALLLAALYAIPRAGKYLVAVLVPALFVVNQAYHATIGHFINVADARVMENADRDVFRGAISAYFRPDMLIFIPIAIALLVLAIYAGKRFPSRANSWGARGVLVVGALVANFALWDYLYIKCHDFPVEALTSMMRTAFYVEKENREFLSVPRTELASAHAAAPTDNIVLIVDESVRVDYVSINNPSIGTTPFLAELSKRPGFINYGLMLAATTCSFTGKALMFTGTTVVPDRDRLAMSNPTIFQHAKRWGYKTIVLDGPGRNFPNIAIRERDLDAVDVLLRASEIPGTSPFADINAAEYIRKTVTESRGNFIVLIKVGAHFHYERCYPSSEGRYSRFLPKLMPHESYGSSRERTINSYKNALTFTVDTFFETLARDALPGTTIFWTSDHGQSLQEHGQTYTHCKDELEQAVVPFVVLSDVPWVLENAARPSRDLILTHDHLFPSLVSVFAKRREEENGGYRSLFSARVVEARPPLRYVYGGVWANSRVLSVDPARLEAFRSKP